MKKSASQPQAEAAYGAPVCRAALEDCFRRCADFSSRRLSVGAEGRIELFVCWIDGMISASEAAEDVLRPLTDPLRAAADADAGALFARLLAAPDAASLARWSRLYIPAANLFFSLVLVPGVLFAGKRRRRI